LFDSLKSIHTANVLLETVILPAFDEVPALTEEERRAIEYFTGFTWTVIRFRVALHGLLNRLCLVRGESAFRNEQRGDQLRATTDHANVQRLTDAERIALCNARDAYAAISEDDEYYAEIATAIRGVVERLG